MRMRARMDRIGFGNSNAFQKLVCLFGFSCMKEFQLIPTGKILALVIPTFAHMRAKLGNYLTPPS